MMRSVANNTKIYFGPSINALFLSEIMAGRGDKL
jgi:hypothetical protein